jgi:hypothetical protein
VKIKKKNKTIAAIIKEVIASKHTGWKNNTLE